jgi:hypothetical protein
VVGRQGGEENKEAAHYFDHEDDARVMLRRMLNTVPPEFASWAEMTAHKKRPR